MLKGYDLDEWYVRAIEKLAGQAVSVEASATNVELRRSADSQ